MHVRPTTTFSFEYSPSNLPVCAFLLLCKEVLLFSHNNGFQLRVYGCCTFLW